MIQVRRDYAQSFALETNKFNAKVKSVKTRGSTLQQDIHVLLMSALAYSLPEESGGNNNAAPFVQIVEALPDAIRKSDVRRWVEQHTNVRITAGKKDGVMHYHAKLADTSERRVISEDDVAQANLHPFYEAVAKSDADNMVYGDEQFKRDIERILSKVKKAKEGGKLVLSDATRQRGEALLAMYNAMA